MECEILQSVTESRCAVPHTSKMLWLQISYFLDSGVISHRLLLRVRKMRHLRMTEMIVQFCIQSLRSVVLIASYDCLCDRVLGSP
jgi:hypothetical protein